MKAKFLKLTLVAAVSVACEDTDECVELRRVLKTSERALAAAKGRAALAERTGRNLERIKADVTRKLENKGLDLEEGALVETMEARAESESKVTFERTVRPMAPDPTDVSQAQKSETVLRFNFPARDLEAAWAIAERLAAEPPMTRMFTLIAPKRRRQPWRLELGRVDIQRLPMSAIEPRALPPRRSAADVPEEFGFCGAGELRSRLGQIDAEIEGLAEKAGQTTVNLPLFASWKGLSRRADLAIDIETRSRELAKALVDATLASKQVFLGLALEKEAVLLEVKGGAKEKARVQEKLSESLLESIRDLDGGREGVARFALSNPVSAAGRRPDRREEQGKRFPGQDGHGH